jgi:hypothetical protein
MKLNVLKILSNIPQSGGKTIKQLEALIAQG